MTAVLRHVPVLIWFGLLRPLCHTTATSAAAGPVFLGFDFPVKTGYRASYVHIVIRIAFDRRLPLYARKTQTQCLRHQPMAYTPITRAV